MKTKQSKYLIIAVILIVAMAISVVWYFSPRTFLSGVEPSGVRSISVFDGNTGKSFVIEDPAEIRYIVENIQDIAMKRYKVSVGYSGFGFRMSFRNGSGKEPDSFVINSGNIIRDDPFFYRCDGGLCFDYLQELEDQAQRDSESL